MDIDKFLEELKAYLKITEDDEDESLLIPLINTCKSKLENLISKKINWETDLDSRGLLLDYCRYRNNNAEEYFKANFQSDIISLQIRYRRLNSDGK